MGATILEQHAYQQGWRIAWSGRPVPEAAQVRAATYGTGGVLLLATAYAVGMFNDGILLLGASIAVAGPVVALHGQRFTEYMLTEDRFVIKTQAQQAAYDQVSLQGLVVEAKPGIIGRLRGYVRLRLVPTEGPPIVLHGVPSIQAAIIMETLQDLQDSSDIVALYQEKQCVLEEEATSGLETDADE